MKLPEKIYVIDQLTSRALNKKHLCLVRLLWKTFFRKDNNRN